MRQKTWFWHDLYHSVCLPFSGDNILLVTLSKALNWKLASCSICFRTQHSEECSVAWLSFVWCDCHLCGALQHLHSISIDSRDRTNFSISMCVFFLPPAQETMLLFPPIQGTPSCTLKGPKGSLYYKFNSIFVFCTEIIMLDTLNSVTVSYIMQDKYTNNWSHCSCNKWRLLEFPVNLYALSQHHFI